MLSGATSSSFLSRYKNAWTHGFGYAPSYNPTRFDYFDRSSHTDLTYSGLGFTSDNQHSTGDFGGTFTFDGNGNPTTYKNAGFSFDPEDRLTAISSPAFTASYDGDGLRATKTVGGVTTYFLYDGSTPVVEETWNGTTATVTAANGWAADGWRARYEGSVAYDYLYDPQGNLVQRQTLGNYNLGEAAYDQTIYEAYGAVRSDTRLTTSTSGGAATTPHDPAGFGGQYGYYTDTETGLLCLTHRYYDPGTGRFINRDPIGYQGGVNLYGFAGGNPVNGMDPNGTYDLRNLGNDIDDHLLDGSIANWGDVQGKYDSGRATLGQRNAAAAKGIVETTALAGTVVGGGLIVRGVVKVGVTVVARRGAVAAIGAVGGGIISKFRTGNPNQATNVAQAVRLISFFHKGNLDNPGRELCVTTSAEEASAIINSNAPVHQFDVPDEVILEWEKKNLISRFTTTMNGRTITEVRFKGVAQIQMKQLYKK